jgi:hypothetical protein
VSSDFDPNRIYHEIVTAGEDWTDKEAAAELLEETKKTVLAELMQGFHGLNGRARAQRLGGSSLQAAPDQDERGAQGS